MNLRPLALPVLPVVLAACAAPTESPRPAGGPGIVPVNIPAPAGSRLPALAQGGGAVLLAWIEPEGPEGRSIAVSILRDGAWSSPRRAAASPSILVDPASPPAAALLSDGTIAVAWTEKTPGGEYASAVRIAFSRDGGATWEGPHTPHGDRTATEHGFVSLVPDDAGGLDVLWLDGRAFATSTYGEGGTRLYHAAWDGAAFGEETAVDAKVCDCCRTAAARLSGVLLAAYRDREDDERRDISVSRLERKEWSPPRSVRNDGWRLQACPTNGPALAVDSGTTLVAWFTAASGIPVVRAALSTDGGRSFAEPVPLDGGDPVGRVDAVSLGNGTFAVSWLEKKGGRAEVRVRRIGADGSPGEPWIVGVTDSGRASGTPRLASLGDGSVLVTWTDAEGIKAAKVE
jgi:hypothetical protein